MSYCSDSAPFTEAMRSFAWCDLAPGAKSGSFSSLGGRRHAEKCLQKSHRAHRHSPEFWEKAAATAVERASQTLHDLRVAEVAELDLVIESGKVTAYRAKLKVSFKYEGKN